MCQAATQDAPRQGGNAALGSVLCRRNKLTQVFDDVEIEFFFRRWFDAQSYLVRRF